MNRPAEKTKYEFQLHLNCDKTSLARDYLHVYVLHFFV